MGFKAWAVEVKWWQSLGKVLLIGVLLGGCVPTKTTETDSPAKPVAKPQLTVVTTFLPITVFTKAVAGERAQIRQLLPPNIAPHDFQARPQDVQALSTASVLVKNGLGIEAFLEGLIENANNPDLKIIDSSVGISTLEYKAVTHHHHSDEGDGHQHSEVDPHIWLDPKRAIQQVENIRDGLIAADPEGQAIYKANSAAFINELRALDAKATAYFAPFAGKTFVVYHNFAAYFAKSYNLKVEFLVDVPEANPAPADVRRVMEVVQASQLKTLLTEPGQETAFASLAQDMGVKVSVFDPLEKAPSAADLTPAYFLTTMQQNIRNLASAFGAQTRAYRSPESVALVWPGAVLRFAL